MNLLYHADKNSKCVAAIENSGKLDMDFYKYASNFYEAAECVIRYLEEEASQNHDIAKLDLWYFAMIYLYRQSLELILKANIFQIVTDVNDRQKVVQEIFHNLKKGFEKLIEIRNLKTFNGVEWLMNYLDDISKIDEGSDAFRYPFNQKHKAVFERQTHISLIETHKNMTKAYKLLESLFMTGTFIKEDGKPSLPKLIIEGGCYYQQSVVCYKYSQFSFYPYFESYTGVGEFLKNIIINENTMDLFIPMCYMYRNAAELGLKRLIIDGDNVNGVTKRKILGKKKHSLSGLWKNARATINNLFDDVTLDEVTQSIDILHDIDPVADKFRYPSDKVLNPYFRTKERIDVERLSSFFEDLCTFLDGADVILSETIDFTHEYDYNNYDYDYNDDHYLF